MSVEVNIVIPVYNRLRSVTRLVDSLLSAKLSENVNLYISCEGNVSLDVLSFVKNIQWPFGGFTVIEQSEQLGVDKHNLVCMRMAEQLGNVLVLEDDMVVSPFFQAYLNKSTVNVSADVSGIALYRYSIVEQNHFPFYLIPNDEFVYYQQRACSNGTFYTWEMLKPYFEFLDSFAHNYSDYHLPENVRKWGDEVWEKSFYCYLIKNKKYLAFPRFSLSTDFADYGVHMKKQTLKYVHQTKLYLGSTFGKISRLEDTHNVFDSFYELSPKTIKRFNKELSDYDFESDVYGFKDLQYVKTPYLLSSKNTLNAKCGWERRLKPEINNVLLNQIGDFYSLGKTGGFIQKNHIKSLKEDFLYYYPDTKLTDLVRMKITEVFSRLF